MNTQTEIIKIQKQDISTAPIRFGPKIATVGSLNPQLLHSWADNGDHMEGPDSVCK